MGGRRAARVAMGDQSKSGYSSSQSCAPRASPQPLPLILPRVLARTAAACHIDILIVFEDVPATRRTRSRAQRTCSGLVPTVPGLSASVTLALMSGFWVTFLLL